MSVFPASNDTAAAGTYCTDANYACVNTKIDDGAVVTSFFVFLFMAAVVFSVFGCVRHSIPIYSGRCYLRALQVGLADIAHDIIQPTLSPRILTQCSERALSQFT